MVRALACPIGISTLQVITFFQVFGTNIGKKRVFHSHGYFAFVDCIVIEGVMFYASVKIL